MSEKEKEKEIHIGVDEAGRGPVFGSMFVYGVARNKDTIQNDLRDSKRYSKKRISELGQELLDDPESTVVGAEITSTNIDECETLTELSITAYSAIINELVETSSADPGNIKVIVDAFVQDEEKCAQKIQDNMRVKGVEIHAEHEADDTYSIVSEASILAKHNREEHISELSRSYPRYEIGSGYPSDQATREFLAEYYQFNQKFPKETRMSWSTVDKIRENM